MQRVNMYRTIGKSGLERGSGLRRHVVPGRRPAYSAASHASWNLRPEEDRWRRKRAS
jgi:hypothetical protein